MTTMDSDSESQDSDDGRRFRFEATRKDAAKLPKFTGSLKDNLKYHESTTHRDKSERPRHENDYKESGRKKNIGSRERNEDDKDFRHTTKYSKHTSELRISRREESKSTYSDSKRYKDRNRDSHHRRSRERSYDRDKNHDEKLSDIKHRTKFRDKDKHRLRHKSRDRSSQSNRVRSDADTTRDNHRKQDYDRKSSRKDYQSKISKDSSTSNIEDSQSIDNHHYKDVDLSQFDVLSETDDNLSDGVGSENSIPHSNTSRANIHISSNQSEDSNVAIGNKHMEIQNWDTSHKVNPRNIDSLSGSSSNNPSTISDYPLNSASPAMSETLNSEKRENRHSEKNKVNTGLTKEREVKYFDETLKNHSTNSSIKGTNIPKEDNTDVDSSAYGPVLPPQFSTQSDTQSKSIPDIEQDCGNSKFNTKSSENKHFIGPTVPSEIEILEHNTPLQSTECDINSEEDVDSTFGPALPPHLLQQPQTSPKTRNKIVGPTLPSSMKLLVSEEAVAKLSESEDEDGIGPLPMDHPAMKNNCIYDQLEERARRLREELQEEAEEDANKREEWMMELPPAQAVNLGLGPRKFRARPGPDMTDRSCWTDVPGKKTKHKKEQDSRKVLAKKDTSKIIVDEESRKHKKQEKSLLEIHQEKLQKRKKKEDKKAKLSGKTERRPFDRDIDLQANRFDQAQKKTILMKAQLLNDRFSRGEM